jgi:hypothetical protein
MRQPSPELGCCTTEKPILIFHLNELYIVHSFRFSNIVRLTEFCYQINLVKIHVDAVLERGEERRREGER